MLRGPFRDLASEKRVAGSADCLAVFARIVNGPRSAGCDEPQGKGLDSQRANSCYYVIYS
jgi:hypothetical protein